MTQSRLRRIGQWMMRAVIDRLPEPVADRLRTSLSAPTTSPFGRPRHSLLTALWHGRIPPAIRTFQLADNPVRLSAIADSLVLAPHMASPATAAIEVPTVDARTLLAVDLLKIDPGTAQLRRLCNWRRQACGHGL